ncbi:unnamed protein product [Rotaria sp. Silwood1]|nr:unnamed protein product [Rotaria sp. Silwood1]CAF1331625.1 unnamed protein product [Rotaria sp. Silwood1]CAF3577431.1 unnamed protein product [Rotaria sp. Silwood1]
MEQVKRQQNNLFDNYDDSKRKKIASKSHDCLSRETITNFEVLSNELIYEVFEFLDYFHIYKAFFNLNIRFRNLLTNSSLPIKVNISSISKSAYQQYYTDIIRTNAYRINSLRLSNLFIYGLTSSPIQILSKFLQLERLILDNIESKYLKKLLHSLKSLSMLSSLTITSLDNIKNKNAIYHQIFCLPALKYCKVSLEGYSNDDDPLPSITNDYSPIEHLVINDDMYLDELNCLTSYVPQLRRFSIQLRPEYWKQRTKIRPPTLNHLTHVFLKMNYVNFNQFEQLVIDLFATIQFLRISITYNGDTEYMNNKRWEQLILSHMPNLRIFDIRYERCLYNMPPDDNNQLTLDSYINQFTTPFWIERQWFFALRRKSYTLSQTSNQKTCLNSSETNLRTVRHVRIQCEKELINWVNYFPNATELTFESGFSTTHESIANMLRRIIPLEQLSILVLECHYFSFIKLIELLRFIPNIDTLIFKSMPFYRNNCISIQQTETFRLVSNKNRITNVTFKEVCTLEKLRLLVALCPRLQSLTIKIHMKDLESITRFLLENNTKENTDHLCSLCFSAASTKWFEKLDILIKSEILLDVYNLKLVGSNLYLWW